LEFVDFDYEAKASVKSTGKGKAAKTDELAAKKAEAKVKKVSARAVAAKKKNVKRIQKKDRAESRA
jgi:large subunit ribosomal protein L17